MVKTVKTFYLTEDAVKKLEELAGDDSKSMVIDALINTAYAKFEQIKIAKEADRVFEVHT